MWLCVRSSTIQVSGLNSIDSGIWMSQYFLWYSVKVERRVLFSGEKDFLSCSRNRIEMFTFVLPAFDAIDEDKSCNLFTKLLAIMSCQWKNTLFRICYSYTDNVGFDMCNTYQCDILCEPNINWLNARVDMGAYYSVCISIDFSIMKNYNIHCEYIKIEHTFYACPTPVLFLLFFFPWSCYVIFEWGKKTCAILSHSAWSMYALSVSWMAIHMLHKFYTCFFLNSG